MKRNQILIMVQALLVLSNYPTNAQQFNMSQAPIEDGISIGLKVNKPFFKNSEYDDLPKGLSGVYNVYGCFSLKNNWQINTEIPLVITKTDDSNDFGLGNIYAEIQKAFNNDKTTWLSLGVYIPTIGEEEYLRQFMGLLSDPYSFVQYLKGFTIRSTFGYNLTDKPGPIFGLNVGPDLFIPTNDYDEVELMLHYGIKGGYRFNSVSTWAELSGIMMVTEEGDLSDRWINQVNVGAQLNQGRFRPGVFYSLYLDKDYRDMISGILGLDLQVNLN